MPTVSFMSVQEINQQANSKRSQFKAQEAYQKIKSNAWLNKLNNLKKKMPKEDNSLIWRMKHTMSTKQHKNNLMNLEANFQLSKLQTFRMLLKIYLNGKIRILKQETLKQLKNLFKTQEMLQWRLVKLCTINNQVNQVVKARIKAKTKPKIKVKVKRKIDHFIIEFMYLLFW